jgi:hypothetical protein
MTATRFDNFDSFRFKVSSAKPVNQHSRYESQVTPSLPRSPGFYKLAGLKHRAERLPDGLTRLRGVNGMMFFVIETHLSLQFQPESSH